MFVVAIMPNWIFGVHDLLLILIDQDVADAIYGLVLCQSFMTLI